MAVSSGDNRNGYVRVQTLMNWTPEQLKEAEQRIQARCQVRRVQHQEPMQGAPQPKRKPIKRKHIDWGERFQLQCVKAGIPSPELEHRFCPERRWRLDAAWVRLKIAVEVEGGVWINGRHNRGKGFLLDMDKYNNAGKRGWRIFRFTPSQVAVGKAVEFMKGILGA